MDRRRHRLDGIRPAEVCPTVAAGTGHAHAESPASQRLMRDALKPGSIDGNKLALPPVPRRIVAEMPNSAQIPFSLFTDVSDANHGPVKTDGAGFCSA